MTTAESEKDKAIVGFALWVIALGGVIVLAPLHEFGHWLLCEAYGGYPLVVSWFQEVFCSASGDVRSPHFTEHISMQHPEALYLYRFWGGGAVLLLLGFASLNRGGKWQWLFSSLVIIALAHGINAIEEAFLPVQWYAYIGCDSSLLEALKLQCKPELQAGNHIFMVTVGTAIGYFGLLLQRAHLLPKKSKTE